MGPYQYATWPAQDWEAHLAFLKGLNRKLEQSGELVGVVALEPAEQARRVRAGKDGKPITDGVFPEAKEFLAGFWIVDVDRAERAYDIAAQASAAPGPGGAPLGMAIEVRQLMTG
jgi:hypothetical protein